MVRMVRMVRSLADRTFQLWFPCADGLAMEIVQIDDEDVTWLGGRPENDCTKYGEGHPGNTCCVDFAFAVTSGLIGVSLPFFV